MTLHLPIRPRTLFILALILLAVVFFTWVTWQFDQATRQSERHNYYYTIDLSYNTTIENVTLFLPVPELNNTPFFTESLLNKTAYGVPPDWDLSLVNENGSPMLAIRAARMVPDYHGSPSRLSRGRRVPSRQHSFPVTSTPVIPRS